MEEELRVVSPQMSGPKLVVQGFQSASQQLEAQAGYLPHK
jgi:hypothetical protein